MMRYFNVTADCKPGFHYMVDIEPKLQKIKAMIDKGEYFTINRARQYGKTTTLRALRQFLKNDYVVISLDFQMMSTSKFRNENTFSVAFAEDFLDSLENLEEAISPEQTFLLKEALVNDNGRFELFELFRYLSKVCSAAPKPIVLLIDEVDSAANNQVFLDFLAQLRGYYINRDIKPTFQSVILAGVYDVKNIRRKLRTDDEHKQNSPWNIAADFLVDMSFSAKDIAGMLKDYEDDYRTGMDIGEIAGLLYAYTAGYPYLVSKLCKLIDERVSESENFPSRTSAWTKEGFLEAVKILLGEKNTLFESLSGKLNDYPELKNIIYLLLFQGQTIVYNPDDPAIDTALMFGFVKADKGYVVIANRIFETRLYNMFLALPEVQSSEIYRIACQNKNQFIIDGHLNMKLILERFVVSFDDIYGDQGEKFYEEDSRRYFMLYLKPIINGTGNYYVEAQTRNMERTDLIVDYQGEQFIIEMKIWRGDAYNTRGENQLLDYLDYYHLKKGYMLSFNFNKNKEIGVKEIKLGQKTVIEAIV